MTTAKTLPIREKSIQDILTYQEVFDRVWDWFITLQRPLCRIREACLYRSPNNGDIKCAVGLFIPDEIYSSNMEGYGVNEIIKRPEMKFLRIYEPILRMLQIAHDRSSSTKDLKERLLRIAQDFSLKIPI